MDFFEAQARARKRTHRLVLLFTLAVAGTIATGYAAAMTAVNYSGARSAGYRSHGRYYATNDDTPARPVRYWDPAVFSVVALGTLAVVGLASLYKWSQMRQGGAAVAAMVGGRAVDPHTTDLRERRLLNVVEEMAIAAGVPVPAVYVLDDEMAINAFAAGLTTSDAVVTVTRGTLEKLTRDELQGVIGHEFSHILNGDMALNLRLTAIIFGILVLGLAGRGILWSLRGARFGSSRDKNSGGIVVAIMAVGLALLIVGYVGYFFGRLIQAAVSRQREFLADASSVQFTRNPGGITGALKKIGGYAIGSEMTNHGAAELSHFFFAQGFRSMFGGLWATHPPLGERLRALDPQFDGKFIEPPEVVDVAQENFVALGLAGRPAAAPPPTAAAVIATIGNLTPENMAAGRALLAAVPPRLREAARQPAAAPALVYALLLDPEPGLREKQFGLIGSLDSGLTLQAVRDLAPAVVAIPAGTRLPLVNLTLPALRNLPATALDKFIRTTDALITADGTVSAFEFMLQKALLRHVTRARAPAQHDQPRIFALPALAAETGLVLSVLACAAGDARPAQVAAFAAGVSQLPAIRAQLAFAPTDSWDFSALDAALARLATAAGPIKQELLFAAAHVVSQDGVIQPAEAELLRAIADALDCPMPVAGAAA